jgi:hypothetical protein
MQRPKLFHTLVAMGVSLTGGTFTTTLLGRGMWSRGCGIVDP